MTVWLALLALIGVLLYLNQAGLPGFIKQPLLGTLRARGVDLQFSRLRLRWYEGIVAENVRFGQADDPSSPQLTAAEVQVRLSPKALARFQMQVDSLVLHRGRLLWPLAETNWVRRQLSVENIQTELRFLPRDQWALEHFKARFAGANIRLSGALTNASAAGEWRLLQAGTNVPVAAWPNRLRQLADALEEIHFSIPPELRLDVRGDARDFQSFTVWMALTAPDAQTPWGALTQGRLTARLLPAAGGELPQAELGLEAASAQTPWGNTTNLQLALHLASPEAQTNIVTGTLTLQAGALQTEWASATDAQFTAHWVYSLAQAMPLSSEGRIRCAAVQTKWGRAKEVEFSAHQRLEAPASLPAASENQAAEAKNAGAAPHTPCDASWTWWTNLQGCVLDWQGRLTALESPELNATAIACGGTWRAPEISVTNLLVRFLEGQLEAHVRLNTATRALNLTLASDFDPHHISPVLPEDGRRWLDQFSWDTPPRLKGDIALVLPAWTNRQPDWRAEVQPTLRLNGEFSLDRGGTYRQLHFSAAHSHFAYSNLCWRLPDFTAVRPEGRLEAEHQADERSRDYYWRVRSTINVHSLRPLLEAEPQSSLELLTFTQPPLIEAEIRGRSHDPERTGVKGRIALTNFTFRGESISGLQTAFQYTNRLLQFFEPRVQRGTQHLSAAGLAADFAAGRVYLTNGLATAEPSWVARAIGPQIGRTMEPYQFSEPVIAQVSGVIPMHGEAGADLRFDVDGGPFRWWKFNVPRIAGHIHWLEQQLTLTNVRADFYGGKAAGSAGFDFRPEAGTDFHFTATTTNTLLQRLMADLSTGTNHLEGALSGALAITQANSSNWRTVNGYGNLALRDGLLWDITLFGILTPVLDSIVPGLGSSRASAATCSFVVTNGVLRSEDLEARSLAMRLQYRGTVDLESRVNARVEAELLRDMWLFGPVVSTVFWPVTKLFECKVTGSLDDPKAEPVFLIPRLVLMPFHPFRTLKGFLPEDKTSTQTNAPPAGSP